MRKQNGSALQNGRMKTEKVYLSAGSGGYTFFVSVICAAQKLTDFPKSVLLVMRVTGCSEVMSCSEVI